MFLFIGGRHEYKPGDFGIAWTKSNGQKTIQVQRSGLCFKLDIRSSKLGPYIWFL